MILRLLQEHLIALGVGHHGEICLGARKLAADTRGIVAIETAVCLPVLCILIVGGVCLGFDAWVYETKNSNLLFMAQGAAQYSPDPGQAKQWANNASLGTIVSDATFTANLVDCGIQVTGSDSFNPVPLDPFISAQTLTQTACWPVHQQGGQGA